MVEYEFAESYLEPTTISLNFALVVVTIDIDNLMLNPELAKTQRKVRFEQENLLSRHDNLWCIYRYFWHFAQS